MRPRLLKQFLTIARLGSMSAAARELGIAQPALSKQMLQLEHELQVKLFERHSRGVTLTKSGEKLRVEAADLIRRMEGIKSAIKSDNEKITGQVVLAVITSLAPVIASELYPRLEQEFPDISLHIVDYSSELAGHALMRQDADLAIIPSAALDLLNVESMPLFEESFHLVSKSQNRFRTGYIKFEDAAAEPLILPFHNHDLRRRLEDAARSIGVTLNVKFETGSINVISAMVERGTVSSIVPITHWLDHIATSGISARRISDPEIKRVHSLCWLPERKLSAAAQAVQDMLISEIQSLIATGKLSGTLIQS